MHRAELGLTHKGLTNTLRQPSWGGSDWASVPRLQEGSEGEKEQEGSGRNAPDCNCGNNPVGQQGHPGLGQATTLSGGIA